VSYFGRLVEQSHLTVAGAGADSRDVSQGGPVAAGAIDSRGVMNGDAVDLIEINEVVDAPPMPEPSARQEVAERAASSPIERDAFIIARANSSVELPSAAIERDRPVERVDAQLVSAPSDPSRVHETSTPREGSTYDIAMRRVLEWVAAGPRPDVTPVSDANQASIEERAVDGAATGRARERSRDDESAIVEAIVAAARETPTRVIESAARVEQAATSVVSDPHSPSTSQRAASASASVVEDVVQVSIGSISVRIEAPPPPAPTVVAPPPRSAAPAPRESPAPERGTRLARRYLHP